MKKFILGIAIFIIIFIIIILYFTMLAPSYPLSIEIDREPISSSVAKIIAPISSSVAKVIAPISTSIAKVIAPISSSQKLADGTYTLQNKFKNVNGGTKSYLTANGDPASVTTDNNVFLWGSGGEAINWTITLV